MEGTIAITNQIHPDLAVSGELAGLALADFDAISNLFADKGRVDTSWDLVYGDVAAATAFQEGEVVVVGEELCVDGDGADKVVFVGGDGEIFAAVYGDILGWGGFLVVFVCVEFAEGFAGAVWVKVCPDASDALRVDCA